jgi:hypothetical protein
METKAKKAAQILEIILIAAMALIAALLALITFTNKWKTVISSLDILPAFIFFYTAGALVLWFLLTLRLLVRSVRAGNPFVRRNVTLLKRLALSLFFLMLDFVFVFCLAPTLSKLLCVGLLLLGVFCARVLAYLIERAAEYREEIDLTV